MSRTRSATAALSGVLLVVVTVLAGCGPSGPTHDPGPSGPTDCSALKNLAVLAWANHAGLVPQERSLGTWIEDNPSRDALAPLPRDEPLDVVTLWQQRTERPDPWNDLVSYQQDEGLPWLVETDLDEIVPVLDGQDGDDPAGWRSCG